tara:strand:+ start:3831 stop:4907 length:1077 start_codon:yes stop_codon:yes gene_type:complete
MKKKTILVTGAAGFIGFHLSKKLCESGFEVIGIDNLNDYYEVFLKKMRLEKLGIHITNQENQKIESDSFSNFIFYKSDILDYDSLSKCIQDNRVDIIINLAAQAGVRHSLKFPHDYISNNITGFLNILEVSRYAKIEHLIYASSSSVYGLNQNIPFSTQHSTEHPTSVYAASKKSNELLAHSYSHLYGLPTTGLRFFTVYGPYGRPDMALFLFLKAIIDNKKLKVFNEGNMYRDFTYVDDIVNTIEKIALTQPLSNNSWDPVKPDPSSSIAPYKIYNIGNNVPVKLTDFIKEIENKMGVKANLDLMPMQPGDVESTHANIDETIEHFQYRPNTSVKEGISRFIDWYFKYKDILKKNNI